MKTMKRVFRMEHLEERTLMAVTPASILDIQNLASGSAPAATTAPLAADGNAPVPVAAMDAEAPSGEAGWVWTTGGTGEFYAGVYYDVQKTWSGDSMLCWAAATSNVMYYAGWLSAGMGYDTPEGFYGYMKDNFTDEGGHLFYSFQWATTGEYTVKGSSGWAQPTDGSGGFYPGIDIAATRVYASSKDYGSEMMSVAAEYLEDGYGAVAAIGWYSSTAPAARHGGHSISLRGYTYDTSLDPSDPEYYTALIVTNSDDRFDGLVYMSLEWHEDYQMYRLSDFVGGIGWLEDVTLVKPTSWMDGFSVSGASFAYDGCSRSVAVEGDFTNDDTLVFTEDGENSGYAAVADEGTHAVGVTVVRGDYEGIWAATVEIAVENPFRTITVTTNGDSVEDDGLTSLREAVVQANELTMPGGGAEGETVLVVFADELAGETITLGSELAVTGNVRIAGRGAISVSGGALCRVFSVNGGNLYLAGLALRDARAADGGAIAIEGGTLTLCDCQVVGCAAEESGGAVWSRDSGVVLANSLLVDNAAGTRGGAVYMNGGSLAAYNTTIAGNSASEMGGGVCGFAEGNPVSVEFFNTIIATNTAEANGDIAMLPGDGANEIRCCADHALSSYGEWTFAEAAIAYDPTLPLFEEGSYRLHDNSQALSAGASECAVYPDGGLIALDLDGGPRRLGAAVDLGAFESIMELAALEAPVIDSVSSRGADSQRVHWIAVDNATRYEFAFSEDGETWESKVFSCPPASTGLGVNMTGLIYGTHIYYRVRALGDGVSCRNSEWSETWDALICPVDTDSDGYVGPLDYEGVSAAWLTASGGAGWNISCDIDGDGFVGPGDYSYLAANWLKNADSEDIAYPPQPEYSSAGEACDVSQDPPAPAAPCLEVAGDAGLPMPAGGEDCGFVSGIDLESLDPLGGIWG